MQLTEEQKQKVAGWIAEGLRLSEIQDRLGNECGVRLTYMEARLLVDDLKLLPKETVAPEAPKPADAVSEDHEPQAAHPESGPQDALQPPVEGKGGVSIKVDTLTRPGAMVSGSATFSDGETVGWSIDQFGRLGLVPSIPGYRPPQKDIPEFQMLLEKELSRMGM